MAFALLGTLVILRLNFKDRLAADFLIEESFKSPSSSSRVEWLTGLMGLTGIHLAEYRPEQVGWELWAPSANVRLQRYSFGSLRTRPLLHFFSPRAIIHLGDAALDIQARRVYYNPQKSEWVFVQGEIRRGEKRRKFRQLHWFPKTKRLEWPQESPLHPLFRFWEPRY